MKGFLLGIVVTSVCLFGCAYVYFARGLAPVATSAPPMPFEKQLANMALDARVDKEAPKQAPFEINDATYIAGVHVYLNNCAVCHGTPGTEEGAIAKGEFPHPPQLFRGHGVTDDPAGETYWKTANGIRLTGMPGFRKSLSDLEMWQVSLMLANADKMPATATSVLTGQDAPMTVAPTTVPATK